MCDTACVLTTGGTLFAKNSDRPVNEVQLVHGEGRRPATTSLRTQYLTIPDVGAAASVMARPTWLWGAEHGVNEHGVAIGNERIYTLYDANALDEGLLGMDLVRLALESAHGAEQALGLITDLVDRYGQGGVGDTYGEGYYSSFLICDATQAWVLETAGREWAAKPVSGSAAISNRISLGTDWARSSNALEPGSDFDAWRETHEPTGHADRRLDVTRPAVASIDHLDARAMASLLRDHGAAPWGRPGSADPATLMPERLDADFTGISVCMHVRDYMTTTSSMIAALPAEGEPPRVWASIASPCISVFLPVWIGADELPVVPAALSSSSTFGQLTRLRIEAERELEFLAVVRDRLDPLEATIWAEADAMAAHRDDWVAAADRWSAEFALAVEELSAPLPEIELEFASTHIWS